MINFDAIMPSKTDKLNQFLVDKGVDYSVVTRFGGRDETVFVIFNNNLIKHVKSVPAKEVDLNMWELNPQFVVKKQKNNSI